MTVLICTLESYPSNELHAVMSPIKVEIALFGHPPPFVKVNKTSEAFPCGDVT